MKKYSKFGKAAIILILLFLWYSMIFSFSAQNGETSGSLSGSIALKTVQVFDKLTFGHRSEENIALLAKKAGISHKKSGTLYRVCRFRMPVVLFLPDILG